MALLHNRWPSRNVRRAELTTFYFLALQALNPNFQNSQLNSTVLDRSRCQFQLLATQSGTWSVPSPGFTPSSPHLGPTRLQTNSPSFNESCSASASLWKQFQNSPLPFFSRRIYITASCPSSKHWKFLSTHFRSSLQNMNQFSGLPRILSRGGKWCTNRGGSLAGRSSCVYRNEERYCFY